ncbi:MAG: Aspartyl/glutamyl-tRNA(Asn/Gln) amidotransferase subunit, partial [Verrucomicrobiota bacterium]
EVKAQVVELPIARKQRFMLDFDLPAGDADVFKLNPALAGYYEGIAMQANPENFRGKAVANWVINNLSAKLAELNEREKSTQGALGVEAADIKLSSLADLKFKPEALLELVALVEAKTISSSAAQQVFAEMFETGKAPAAIVQEKGLAQVSDTGAIEKFCDEAIAANPAPVADYKAGKVAALNSLKGQVMKLSKGKANPALVGEILERKLKA